MKLFGILIFCGVFFISCNNKITNIKFEKIENLEKNIHPFVKDYYYSYNKEGIKDSLMVEFPVAFHLKNNTNRKLKYENVREGDYVGLNIFILNDKKYYGEDFRTNVFSNPNSMDNIVYYFQTPVSKKDLELDKKIKLLLNDKSGDSILINNLPSYIEKKIIKNLSKETLIIKLKDVDNNKNIGIRYCFNKDKAITYDVDSLIKVNPNYRFECK